MGFGGIDSADAMKSSRKIHGWQRWWWENEDVRRPAPVVRRRVLADDRDQRRPRRTPVLRHSLQSFYLHRVQLAATWLSRTLLEHLVQPWRSSWSREDFVTNSTQHDEMLIGGGCKALED